VPSIKNKHLVWVKLRTPHEKDFPLIGQPQNDWMILKLTNVLGGYTTNWLGLQKDLTALDTLQYSNGSNLRKIIALVSNVGASLIVYI
jgi:hypothetical protein